MRDALRESDQLTIRTHDDDAEPIVRRLREGVFPLPLTNGVGGAGTAVCLDERGHVELSQGRHVGGGGNSKPKVAGDHVMAGSSPIIYGCVKTWGWTACRRQWSGHVRKKYHRGAAQLPLGGVPVH